MAQRYLPIGAPGGAPISKSGGRLDVVGLGLIALAVLALLNGMVNLHGATRDVGVVTRTSRPSPSHVCVALRPPETSVICPSRS